MEQVIANVTCTKRFSKCLKSRIQQTKFNGAMSSIKINVRDVPQETVVATDLFVLYVNDIVEVVEKCKIQLFSDDTILFPEHIWESLRLVEDVHSHNTR